LPTEDAARIALRTQQIIGYESGITDTPDPLAGSYYVESLTNEVERLAWEYIEQIEALGGAVQAIESGFQMGEIEESAYSYTKSIDDGSRVVVGVNKFEVENDVRPTPTKVDPELERNQIARVTKLRATRNQSDVMTALAKLKDSALKSDNVLYPMKDALRANATLGEVSDVLREVFGVYQPS
jgi:methylmalonyl-CoA mutase N-terminal domain/subunit